MKHINPIDTDSRLWDYHQTKNGDHLQGGYPRQDILIKKIHKLVQAKSKVLEIGFGNGYLLKRLSQDYQCFGADVSEENINQTRSQSAKVDFRLINTDGNLPYPNEYFDAFVASEVLEHMDDSELQTCVAEVYRVLNIGGYAFITFPAEEDLKRNECFCPNCESVFHKWGHKQFWNRKKIRRAFNSFELISIDEYFNRFVGETFFERVFGWFAWFVQTGLNYIWKFPARLFTNRSYIVILRKPLGYPNGVS